MPTNVLKKDTARGHGPPPTNMSELPVGEPDSQEEKQRAAKEAELAAQEMEAMWESQEVGITRWSEGGGSRYSD